MKKNFIIIAAAVVLGLSTFSCNNDNSKAPAKQPSEKTAAAALPNYRYVDLDTILSQYNLAKDYNEEMLRMQNNMENTARQKENSLQSAANNLQKKYQNSTYLSKEDQQTLQNEQQRIANMQSAAQKELANLQNSYLAAADQAQRTINDSINAFIKDYNAKRGYDAIFFKGATLYINPALDITAEVVEGLNARYNKMKK